MKRQRIRDLGYPPGTLKPGEYNGITDVEGVGVGHSTIIKDDDIRTGVTAITPHSGNLFEKRVPAAVDILNGYGKTVGLSQILFEGRLEAPIMLKGLAALSVETQKTFLALPLIACSTSFTVFTMLT